MRRRDSPRCTEGVPIVRQALLPASGENGVVVSQGRQQGPTEAGRICRDVARISGVITPQEMCLDRHRRTNLSSCGAARNGRRARLSASDAHPRRHLSRTASCMRCEVHHHVRGAFSNVIAHCGGTTHVCVHKVHRPSPSLHRPRSGRCMPCTHRGHDLMRNMPEHGHPNDSHATRLLSP